MLAYFGLPVALLDTSPLVICCPSSLLRKLLLLGLNKNISLQVGRVVAIVSYIMRIEQSRGPCHLQRRKGRVRRTRDHDVEADVVVVDDVNHPSVVWVVQEIMRFGFQNIKRGVLCEPKINKRFHAVKVH